jgi:hypothetical protein
MGMVSWRGVMAPWPRSRKGSCGSGLRWGISRAGRSITWC